MRDDTPFRECEFCGCITNAKLRACCEQGRKADTPPKPAPQMDSYRAWLDVRAEIEGRE